MAFMDMFKSKSDIVATPEKEYKINLLKERENKVKISLEKKTNNPILCHVVLVLDVSGSMEHMFMSHKVQDIVERIVPISMRLDENKELDCYIFSSNYAQAHIINLDNFDGYVDKEIIKSKRYNDVLWSGTQYSKVMQSIFNEYSKKKLPTFVIMITDGDCSDHRDTEDLVKKSSNYPIFWQYVGVGSARFDFLEKLDNMQGRYVDNANFFQLNDISKISDEQLYDRLLNEFPNWIKEAKSKNIIK